MADIRTSKPVTPELRPGGAGSSYAPPKVTGPSDPLVQQAQTKPTGPAYFGYHTDASIQARLAQQGVAPNAVNLKVAQQMLRYGLPLSADAIAQFAALWQGLGLSQENLEALLALFTLGLPNTDENLAYLLQMMGGGPTSFQLAKLTMLLKNGNHGLGELQALLAQFWKLGALADLGAELTQFEQLMAKLKALLARPGLNGLPAEVADELEALRRALAAQELLAKQEQVLYVPFFAWREQQPMPMELMVEADREDARARQAGFTTLTLGVDTRNLGRVTMNLSLIRGHLSVKLEVADPLVKQLVDPKLSDLRGRLTNKTPYTVTNVGCVDAGDGRGVSILLPRRRNLKRLGRAIGVL